MSTRSSSTFANSAPNHGGLRIVGNLPYNISTPLLFHFLDQADCILDLHLMLQKEVVDRIVADPGNKTYGRLSVMVQSVCDTSSLFRIGPGAFTPAPKVESAFLRLRPRRPRPYPIDDPSLHARLVAAAFGQRRKTLRNSLSSLIDQTLFEEAGIDPTPAGGKSGCRQLCPAGERRQPVRAKRLTA